jgi:hypothetical protein
VSLRNLVALGLHRSDFTTHTFRATYLSVDLVLSLWILGY